jgi:hypothetical protein
MFARYYLYLGRPAGEVSAVVASWVARERPLIRMGGGDTLLTEAGVAEAATPPYDRVDLEIGPSSVAGAERGVMVSVHWRPVGGPALFPDMEGDLAFEPFGPRQTQMTLAATYRAPAGRLGETLDRGLLQRLADATMRDATICIAGLVEELLEASAAQVQAPDGWKCG